MATTTTNYGLNLPEGSDLYNHLVYDNPNYVKIDTELKNNKLRGFENATELVSGTVHALTRLDTDANYLVFRASAKYLEGDTFTLDGSSINAYCIDGTSLPDEAYIIGAMVVCFVNEQGLWFYPKTNLSDVQSSISDLDNDITDINDKLTFSNLIEHKYISADYSLTAGGNATVTFPNVVPEDYDVIGICNFTSGNANAIPRAIVTQGGTITMVVRSVGTANTSATASMSITLMKKL